jgi:hypothetical protein
MPPTVLYNEGWMLRLVLDWLDRNRGGSHALSLMAGARWYSEALLPSRFLATSRGDKLAESHTHADGVTGHFSIAPGERGEAKLLAGAGQFLVMEAKIGSPLSTGTKNAPGYDQAARNVACMAHMIGVAGLRAEAFARLGFCVLLPAVALSDGKLGDLLSKSSIEKKVRARVGGYEGRHDVWFDTTFLPALRRMDVAALTWESVLTGLPGELGGFYDRCLYYSSLRGRG